MIPFPPSRPSIPMASVPPPPFSLLLLLLGLAFAQTPPEKLTSASDLAGLYSLRSSLGIRAKDWPRKADPCSAWTGVQCQSGRVVGLDLSALRRTRLGRLNPSFSVAGLQNLTLLAAFNSTGFALPGPIPDWFGTLLPGPLAVLVLRRSSITGTIPDSIGKLKTLTLLDISSNALSGTVPASLGELSELTNLDLSFNFLSGSIPPTLRGLRNLISLVLSDNSMTGTLPESLFSGLHGLQSLTLSQNKFSGALPNSLWVLPDLRFVDFSYNNFTGTLPVAAVNANSSVAVFNLSHNFYYGTLPSGTGKLYQSLGSLDVSYNYFEGGVAFDGSVNVSVESNCLSSVPNQRSLADCKKFYSDRGMSFIGLNSPDTNITVSSGSSRRKNRADLIYILVGVFGGLLFVAMLVLVLVLCFKRCGPVMARQRESNSNVVPSGGGMPPSGISVNLSAVGDSFTYDQLLQATSNFSEENLMKHGHSGDLYRGFLEGGRVVVVKRIDVNRFKREQYIAELDFFTRASHTRLVPLLGHCLENENEKLLVYKYMPNGDLYSAFYRKSGQEEEGLKSLDWITRSKIAIGVAEALSYLHHECVPPLVHRDIQASSILLDDKFEVRLGSLSEVCMQEGDAHQNVITRFLRLSQSSEPSTSGSPSATCAYDVYCLGKVLLELVTGKLDISGSNDDMINEELEKTLAYINIYERDLLTKILDPSLIVDEDLMEEVWAMSIVAKSCLNLKPTKRPPVKYILKALENPLKVVREENNSNPARLRATSSRGSWNAAVLGSWRSSVDVVSASGPPREAPSGTVGSQESGGEQSFGRRRLSKDIFTEPSTFSRDIED